MKKDKSMDSNHKCLRIVLSIGRIMAPIHALNKWTTRNNKISTCMKVRLMICMYELYECMLSDLSMSRHELCVCVCLELMDSIWVYLVNVGVWESMCKLHK